MRINRFALPPVRFPVGSSCRWPGCLWDGGSLTSFAVLWSEFWIVSAVAHFSLEWGPTSSTPPWSPAPRRNLCSQPGAARPLASHSEPVAVTGSPAHLEASHRAGSSVLSPQDAFWLCLSLLFSFYLFVWASSMKTILRFGMEKCFHIKSPFSLNK